MGHLNTFREAWKAESYRRSKDKRKKLETAFLPAALEIMDAPPRPTGRIVLWTIISSAIFAMAWATFSRVDIVAVAEGRIVPVGKLQSVEASESGTVRAMLVREGDHVIAGQALIELDPTYADADADAARSELATATLQRSRAIALLNYADGNPWQVDTEGALSEMVALSEANLVTARIAEHEAQLDSLYQRLNGADVARRQASTEVARINVMLPMVERQLAERRELANQGFAPKIQVQELEERATTLRFQRAVQQDEMSKAEGESAMVGRDIVALKQGFRVTAGRELSEAEAIIATRGELLEKAERREALQTLVSPVDGIINEIAITTIGEVVEPGQPLITIVPLGDELVVEVFLLNKDVGFIKIAQEAIIKLEAYPFTRYGFLVGEVEHVSADAMIDENRGLVFPARVRITGSSLRQAALGRPSDADYVDLLSPGLSASVEIKTGTRSVLSYLLSPIARSASEAGRER